MNDYHVHMKGKQPKPGLHSCCHGFACHQCKADLDPTVHLVSSALCKAQVQCCLYKVALCQEHADLLDDVDRVQARGLALKEVAEAPHEQQARDSLYEGDTAFYAVVVQHIQHCVLVWRE